MSARLEFAARQLEFEFPPPPELSAPASGQNAGAGAVASQRSPKHDLPESACARAGEQGTAWRGDWFAGVRAAGLSLAATSVGRVLRGQSQLSIEEIADATGLSVRGVRKGVRRLEASGFLATHLGGGRAPGGGGRAPGGGGRRNRYRLTLPEGRQ